MREDRGWMCLPRRLLEFQNGVIEFLDVAFSKAARRCQIKCPCKRCKNRYWYRRHEVYDHLIGEGFVDDYYLWVFHGEEPSLLRTTTLEDNQPNMNDNFDEMLQDRFRDTLEGTSRVQEGPNDEAKKFYRLVEEGKHELYPGCKNFSKLSFIIRLFLFKTLHGLSNVAFNDLLEILREMIPEAELPVDFNEARNNVRDLGLECRKICACPNDCMLYWKEREHDEECYICHTSKWKPREEKQGSSESLKKLSNIPAKVVWYFPLKPRLQRLYMCMETAKYMTWHADELPKDGNLRHPADGLAWKEFDSLYPHFAKEPRNVRLGLASDVFNPFRTMNIAHSTWPVVLINYNLPPWMCLKPEYFMLSLLIPGPESPGNNIDVYLKPLIEELGDLWNDGLETYDKFKNETFRMHAALMWTISDFPGYSMLFGWKTKGKFACPHCNYETGSLYLKHSRKTCYMDHRRFLDTQHPLRRNKNAFNGQTEERPPPKPLSGVDAMRELSSFENSFGKTQKKKNDSTCPWKKRSELFKLPYWQYNTCRHNLDVMHIEKNICDNLIGTLLDISGKSKDHAKARLDLLELGIKEKLQPQLSDDGERILFQKACFAMSSKEKDIFCRVLKEAKLPYGCASNIARCVRSSERKVFGYKSHDAHIILHYLLQIAVRKSLPKHVAIPLIRLGAFFRNLCSKVVKPEELDYLQAEIAETLCELEKVFVPAFFDIMVHLPIHLVNEVKLGGPVHYRGMFFIERYLLRLKSYVRNKSRPEGSIAEGYLIDECLTFCSRYMNDGVKTRINKGSKNSDVVTGDTNESQLVFTNVGYPLGGKKRRKGTLFTVDPLLGEKAHRYALFNSDCKEVDEYIDEHKVYIESQSGRKSRWTRAQNHSHQFAEWFKDKAINNHVPDHIFWLAKGPSPTTRRYKGYYVNGYRFYTKGRDARCKTQNSGVFLTASTPSFASSKDKNPVVGDVDYYGAILDIIELNYSSKFKVVLFHCEWYQVEHDDYGLTCVNLKKLCCADDPFVLPSQVHQVFYVRDPVLDGLHYVMNKVPRDLFDFEGESGTNVRNSYWCEPTERRSGGLAQVADQDIELSREDIAPIVMNANTNLGDLEMNDQTNDSSDCDDTLWDWMPAQEEE